MKKRKKNFSDNFFSLWLFSLLFVPWRVITNEKSTTAVNGGGNSDESDLSHSVIDNVDRKDFLNFGSLAFDYIARSVNQPAASVVYPSVVSYNDDFWRLNSESFSLDSPVPVQEMPSSSASLTNQESLSLEDSDLIDILWRQDIAQEKGSPMATSVEGQHEQDSSLLSEKAYWHNIDFCMEPWNHREGLIGTQAHSCTNGISDNFKLDDGDRSIADIMKDDVFLGQFLTLSPYPRRDNFSTNLSEQPTITEIGGITEMSLGEDELNLSNMCVDGSHAITAEYPNFDSNVAQQQQMFNYNGDLATASNFYQTQPITAVTSQDVDLLRTPSLDMSQMDLTTLFTNRQIMNDVFDSVYAPPEDNSLATDFYRPVVAHPSENVAFPFQNVKAVTVDQNTIPELVEIDDSIDNSPYSYTNSKLYPLQQLPEEPVGAIGRVRSDSTRTVGSVSSGYASATDMGTDFEPRYSGNNEEMEEISRNQLLYDERAINDHAYANLLVTGAEVEVKVENDDEDVDEVEDEEFRSTSSRIGSSIADEEYEAGEGKLYPKSVQQNRLGFKRGRDDELAQLHNLIVSATEICDMSTEEYAQLLKTPGFTAIQRDAIRKIRRRGKNKVAARNSRQRKEQSIESLEAEVQQLSEDYTNLQNSEAHLLNAIAVEKQMAQKLLDSITAGTVMTTDSNVLSVDNVDVYEDMEGKLVFIQK